MILRLLDGDVLIACGGLNRDPYDTSDPALGRLRHLYVAEIHRHQGIGGLLVDELMARAGAFRRVRLRATPGSGSLYETRSFQRVDEPFGTHARRID